MVRLLLGSDVEEREARFDLAYRLTGKHGTTDSERQHQILNQARRNITKPDHMFFEYPNDQRAHGQVRPNAKVEAIINFPVPKCKMELCRFLGMVGYYRGFSPPLCPL